MLILLYLFDTSYDFSYNFCYKNNFRQYENKIRRNKQITVNMKINLILFMEARTLHC